MSGPYRLQVVLRFGDHRAFTDVFKDQVEHEVRDNLRAAFGGLAQVEVVRTHPRLKDFSKNLKALGSWNEVSVVKTHFVLIDYVDNTYYQVQARQHDGLTGQASPVTRTQRTNERPFLARTISYLIDQDFGIVGEITNQGDNVNVEVTLKGADLGKSLDRWVKPGDVFAFVQIVGDKAQPVPGAILRAEGFPEKNGVLKCRLFHRYKGPLNQSAGSRGFRCIKLGTIKAPLRLRLMQKDAKPPKPLNAYMIHVHRQSFESADTKLLQEASHADGYTSLLGKDEPFDNVAFVVIYKPQTGKEEVLARVPVPILDEQPVTIVLDIKQEAATPLLAKQGYWVERINHTYLMDRGRFTELSEMARKAPPEAVLQKAKEFLVELHRDMEELTKERKELEEAEKETFGVKLDLKEGDLAFKRLEQDRVELEKFRDGQQNVVDVANDPQRREFLQMVEQARAREGESEYQKAIDLYEKAQQGLNDAALGQKLDKLKAAWKVKSDAHKEARGFIYGKEWSASFDVDQLVELKERIGRARKEFGVCRQANDHLTPQKLLRVAIMHDKKLKDILKDLHGEVNEEQQKPQAEALAALTELGKLIVEVSAYLEETLQNK